MAPPMGMALTAGLGVLVTRTFLSIPTRMPRLDAVLRILMGLWTAVLLLRLVTAVTLPVGVVAWLVLITLAVLIGAGIQSFHQRP